MIKIFIPLLIPILLLVEIHMNAQQPVSININASESLRPISPFIYGKNNNLSDNKNQPLTANQWQRLKDLGIRMFRENGGNNATKYNWRLKLSSHPDWYNNVYAHDWDYAAKSLQANMPEAQGMWAFQLIGKTAKSSAYNFGDWNYNHSQWWEGVSQNLCGGGVPNPDGGSDAEVEGNPALYLRDWPADSTTAILGHWFGGSGIGLDPSKILYWSMDNEPEIWNGTHDDVFPTQPGAEEFMQRYFAVAKAARALYPGIRLMGPVPANEWQWYMWDGAKISYKGNEYVWLEYFILRIAEEQQASGIKLLDVLDIHFYPGEKNPSDIVQLHRVYFDDTYDYPGANGIKKSGSGSWDNSLTKEYILKRCEDWLIKYLGADHGVGLSVSETAIYGDSPNVSASWYASMLGEFAAHGVEIFTPWGWKTGMDEVIHLFTRYGRNCYIPGISAQEQYISAYPTINPGRDSMTVFLVNRHLTESRIADLNLSNFRVRNGNYNLYTLADLPQSETFVSRSVNALSGSTIEITDNNIQLSLAPLSVSALVLTKSTDSLSQPGSKVAEAEAELGILNGVTTVSTISGYSGSGYVTGFDNSGDKVSVQVEIPDRDLYKVVIRYLGENGAKYQDFSVNNGFTSPVSFPASDTFTTADAGNYFLEQGTNTLTIGKNWGWTDIDKFLVYRADKNSYAISPVLVDAAADENTRGLYEFLLRNFGENIISGQTHDNYNAITSLTGKSPLLRSGDFQHFTEGYAYLWKDGAHTFGKDDDGTVDDLIDWYNSTGKKGLVSMQWHWHSPTGGSPGTNTFYTDYTDFDITRAVTPGTQEYSDIIRDIDDIAFQLMKFRDAGVPVLWRPLHEAGGGWFWWGAKGPEACVELYNILFDRLKNHHQLHNLIWVWSTPETEWYPGNDRVDVIGHDSYPGNYNYGIQKNAFDILYRLTDGKKLIAMTENGPIPDPDACLDSDAPWSWFMSWSNLVVQHNTTGHIQEVYDNPRVLKAEADEPPITFDVTFKLLNDRTLQSLPLTTVTFNSGTQVTNSAGEALFTVNGGSMTYSVNKPSYEYVSGTLAIQSDTTFNLYLTQTHADIKFRLTHDTTPVNLVLVVLNADSLFTNGLGIALFKQVPLMADYSYRISRPGYVPEEGTLYLDGDTTIVFNLDFQTAIQENPEHEGKIKIWPNPASDILNIRLAGDQTAHIIRILDMMGKEVYNQKIEGNRFSINTGGYAPGIYLFQIISDDKNSVQYFIKQ